MATDYNNMGIAVRRLGEPDTAIEYYKKALEIDTRLDNKIGLLRTYKNIVRAFAQKGDVGSVQQYMEKIPMDSKTKSFLYYYQIE
jgi:Tfp pilus assembly protein PilF